MIPEPKSPLSPQAVGESLGVWRRAINHALPDLQARGNPGPDPDADLFVVYIADQHHAGAEFALRQCLSVIGGRAGLQVFAPTSGFEALIDMVSGWSGACIEVIDTGNQRTIDRNQLLRRADFWDRVRGERQLFIDGDTMILGDSLDTFEEFDFVATPWGDDMVGPWCSHGDGRLSLRRRQSMRDLCARCNTNDWLVNSESVLFSVIARLEPGLCRVADDEIARQFAVESVYHPSPFALHKAWKYIDAERLDGLIHRAS